MFRLMSSSLRWPDAALAGLGSSMRTFAGPGMLAVRGRIRSPARIVVLLAGAGELAMDKVPLVPSRTGLPALLGRIGAGAYTGGAVAGVPGAATASVVAAAGTYASWRARGLVVERTGLPDPVVALGEDMIAYGLAAVATRPGPVSVESRVEPAQADRPRAQSGPSHRPTPARDLGIGLLAGLAGTGAMTIAQGAGFALTGAEPSGTPAVVADRLKRRAGRGRLKRRQRPAANQAMHWVYGTSWGIPYGIVSAVGDVPPELSGPGFGLLVWMAGLAQLPALGVSEPVWKRAPASLAGEALLHLVYGIGAGAAVRALRGSSG
jgi:uncharacterized membrane protein